MRIAAIPVLAAVLALVPGCDRVRSFADAAAAGRFDATCAKLPPGAVEVVLLPHDATVDRSRPQDDLGRLGRNTSPGHRVVGLTQATFGYRTSIDLEGLEDARGGRACAPARVRVEVELSGMTIYVAREYAHDPCAEPLILAHERQHVAVFEAYADEATRRLARDLGARYGGAPRRGTTMPALQAALESELRDWLDAFMARARDELAVRNAEVDTADAYASLAQRCGPPA